MAVDLQRRSHLFDSASIGDDNLIGNLDCLILIVGDKNTGDTELADHLFQPAAQLLTHFRINCCKRLVQQQKLRIRRKGSCKCHTLTLSAESWLG